MNYPENFFQRMFSWGRGLELSRRFAVYSSMLLFLVVCAAGAIIWARRSEGVRPYFLYVNDAGVWTVYSKSAMESSGSVPRYRLFQESVAVSFAADYLSVTDSLEKNSDLWLDCKGTCDGDWEKYRLCCAADRMVFDNFTKNVLPKWQKKFSTGEEIRLIDILAEPVGTVSEKGGLWRVTGELRSNKSHPKKITAFIRIASGQGGHARTLGYYVQEFDFYADKIWER